MNLSERHNLLSQYLPEMALPYCVELWHHYQFEFRLSKKRTTKLGDYRFDLRSGMHFVSVNKDLNQYNFLITYIHEIAHCVNVIENGRKVSPHGIEWKNAFRNLMIPLLNPDIFPDDILRPLARHMKNPKASSQSDKHLVLALRKYDPKDDSTLLLDVPDGVSFKLKEREFKKLQVRRSRVLCLEKCSGRNYLISGIATVDLLDR